MTGIDENKIADVIERVVQTEGLELVGWELKGDGSRASMLRITLDSDQGLTHEHCVAVNREVGTILDVEDLIPFHYTLEVTSPGLGKSLSGQPAFDRHRGEIVRIRVSEPFENGPSIKGRVERVTPSQVIVVDRHGTEHNIPYTQILAANTVHAPGRGNRRSEAGGTL
jgi:ribosome maturation factor RimP